MFPRTLLAEARRRTELTSTGVYVLWGPSDVGDLPEVYVGEGDPVQPRIEDHAKRKDFWTHTAVFTSKDQNLNKAHVQHIEARLLELASAAKRCVLDNANQPQAPSLSEADLADAESFLSDVLLCLPLVGVSVFEPAMAPTSGSRELVLKAKGIEARGTDVSQGFIVRRGSRVVRVEVPSIPRNVAELRRTLVKNGVLEERGDSYELIQDYVFPSPSLAAGVVLARSANGRVEWKDVGGRTLKEVQSDSSSDAEV